MHPLAKIALILAIPFAFIFFASVVEGPTAPRPFDVTIWVPDKGPMTVVVKSNSWEVKGNCFYSYSPDNRVMCNVLEVVPCTQQCEPPTPPKAESERSARN